MSNEFISKCNKLGKSKVPFFFAIDFENEENLIFPLDNPIEGVFFDFPNLKHSIKSNDSIIELDLELNKEIIERSLYRRAFSFVNKEMKSGNSYLLNLTFPTKLKNNLDLEQIFNVSKSMFKLFVRDRFVVFSPERFIKISNNKVYSYPMKGTIDASIPNAEIKILNNFKETCEHNTIVDLIRNDLSQISNNVKVLKYRYLEKIKSIDASFFQVSSEIQGDLDNNWNENIGTYLSKLLPAGSVSGAPKKKTVEIIQQAEEQKRGFYTGVFGYFDGVDLDSAVAIRYIEKTKNGFQFRSGGGITIYSNEEDEYNELLDKVYVPTI